MCHEDRHVANDLDAFLFGVSFQFQPLLEEKILIELVRFDLLAQRFASGGQCLFDMACKPRLPGVPGRAVVLIFQRAEQRVIVEPGGGIVAKAVELLNDIVILGLLEIMISLTKQRLFVSDDLAEIDALAGKLRHLLQIIRRQQAVVY